jgi:glycosyltransferase involved in cell wall biosynthesis
LKVLLVCQYFWPESFRINELLLGLVRLGVDCDVLTGQPNYPTGKTFPGYQSFKLLEEHYGPISIFRVPIIPRGTSSSAFQLALNYISFIASASFLGPWVLRSNKYDVILVYGLSPILQAIPAIFLKGFKRCPWILWVQDLWPESIQASGYSVQTNTLRLLRLLVKWIYQSADLILVQSKGFIPHIQKLVPNRRIEYLPNTFFDLSKIDPIDDLEIEGMEKSFPVVFTGNIGNAQAVNVILNAAKMIQDRSDISIVLIGDGSQRNWVLREISRLGLDNLKCPGSLPVEMMPLIMDKAGALLITLVKDPVIELTIPSKLQAYLSAGRPIIGSIDGAGAEVIRESEAGVVVAAEDSIGLARAIIEMSNTSLAKRKVMGTRALKYYREVFSYDRVLNTLNHYLIKATDKSLSDMR